VMMGVPTFYTRLLAAREFTAEVCRSMRLFISGSAPLLAETHESFEARVGHRILERYGMSEAGMITSNPYEGIRKPGTVGKPLPDVELRLVGDDGEACPPGEKGNIQIKGPNVFLGYLNLPDKTRQEFTEDGWFKTGDIGELDDDQYVSIVGRSKDLIITGGYNVYPKEIEAVIDEDERVVESAVFGIADPDFGEAVTAAVVLVDSAVFDQGAFIVGLKERLASYKVPKEIHVVPALPRNAMGKVQKSLLRDTFQSSEQVNKL
jgi:malonyl-CoA/methylmalonyl-CoA synthetase